MEQPSDTAINEAHDFINASREKALAELRAQKAKAAEAGDRPKPKTKNQ